MEDVNTRRRIFLSLSNLGAVKFPGVEFLETASKFRKRKKDSSSCVYVLHKTYHWEISRPNRAVKAKKCTKNCKNYQGPSG